MLSDRERRELREVQRRFAAEDPAFVRSFDDVGRRRSMIDRAAALPRWAYTAALVTAVALGVLMVAARAPGTALVFAVLAAAVLLVRRRRDEHLRRGT